MSDQPPVNVNVGGVSPQDVTNARIEGKIDLILERVGGLSTTVADHETRLRILEANILTKKAVAGIFLGGAAVIGAMAGVVSALVR